VSKPEREQEFLQALQKEWQQKASLLLGYSVVSVYFGGGTPTQLSPTSLCQILEMVRSTAQLSSNCEITIEANPENLDLSLLENLRSSGFNRISIGVQSLDDSSLKILKRPHDAEKAIQAVKNAKMAGFDNISIDLMYDLPHQSLASWQLTLDRARDLPITHCSLYNLTIEPRTPFFRKKDEISRSMPTSALSLKLLEIALDHFQKANLFRYEISAFAKDGLISQHNTGYWTGRPFLGFGPSAFSYWNGSRFENHPNLLQYAKALDLGSSPVSFSESLAYPANVNELLAIHFRLLSGVEETKWNIPEETRKALIKLQEQGLLKKQHSHWSLTKKGTLFYDTVAEEIIS
jgi:oxygen-independent coproporphyrinogen III oxidase